MRNPYAYIILIASLIGNLPVQASTVINFDSLAAGTVVTNQFSGVTFSSEAGFDNRVFSGSPASAPNWLGVTTSAGTNDFFHDTFLNFTSPVNNITFQVVGDHNSGVIAKLDVFENSVLASTLNIFGDGNTTTPQLVDLSSASNVTRIRIYSITDSLGLGYDDFSFNPVPVPIPAASILFASGLAALVGFRKRPT